ncbi:hypothetical protein DV737_g5370, partial [Chaetothyriales sp. CBS 132003]
MTPDSSTGRYEQLSIPSYEEAIASSRPSSSQSRLGPEEVSDDAERQGLLRISTYQAPTVESARPSVDSLDGLENGSEEEVRREMEQMEVEDPLSDSSSSRSLLWRKRFPFSASFPSLTLPSFRSWMPTFHFPQIPYEAINQNRVIIIGRLFGIFLITGIVYVLVVSDVLSFARNKMSIGQVFDPEAIRVYVQNHMNHNGKIQEYLQHLTEFPHLAGTEGNYVLGEWVAELFKSGGLEDVEMEQFDVYLNYPRKDGRRVAIVEPAELKWEAQIEEDVEEAYVFHGHSKSGEAIGPLVYANFGSREDFQRLEREGIPVKDAIVLVRYYGSQGDRALKVKAAELAGAKACIIYSDPAQDGYIHGPTYPDGRFMPQDGVQRGSVSLMSWVVGDVLSPGWASTPENRDRLNLTNADEIHGLNKIPSLPLSWKDGSQFIKALQGKGKQMRDGWVGDPKVEYWTGDGKLPIVSLKNLQDEEVYQPIYNVVGRIAGWEQPERKIIVGNHRDAWCLGGADPGSGTAIMLEIVRIFGELREIGWRPLRTIEFASWDGEEYNLIGSTEHVENRMDELRKQGAAYVNVDVGVTGIDFHVAASPLLKSAVNRATGRVTDPSSKKSVKEAWEKSGRGIEGLGAGSDYVAFQNFAGMSSIDLTFKGQRFPYHSCYDNWEWMDKFGDHGWDYHKALGEVWALLILDLADRHVLPFDLQAYAEAIARYIDDLAKHVKTASLGDLDLSPLRSVSTRLRDIAVEADRFHEKWMTEIYNQNGFEGTDLSLQRLSHNNKLCNFETDLLDLSEGGGLENRTQFKHVIFAPQKWSGYDEAYFPSIRDAIEDGDLSKAKAEVDKVAAILRNATKNLEKEL